MNRRVRTPTVLQMEAVECGAASLAIILQYWGRIVSLEELRIACGVSRDGSKASNVLRAARKFGLDAKGFKKEVAELQQLVPPFIVFWNFNHFIVVEGFRRGRVYLNDPGSGPRYVTRQEFDQGFTGVVLTFAKTDAFRRGGRSPSLASLVWERLPGSRLGLLYLLLATACLTLPGLAAPVLYRTFIDQFVLSSTSNWLKPLLAAMCSVAAVAGVLTFLQQRVLVRMEMKLAVKSSATFLWHVLRLPMDFFSQRFAGELVSRVTINDDVASLISGDVATNAVNFLMIGVYGLLMFRYDKELAAIGVTISLLNLAVLKFIARYRTDSNRRLLQERGKLLATSMAGLQGMETLKASGTENDFFAKWSGYQAKVMNAEQALGATSQFLSAVPILLGALNSVAILCLGGLKVIKGSFTIGMLIAFQTLLASFSEPVNKLMDLGGKLQEAEGDLVRLNDVLRYPAGNFDEAESASKHSAPLAGHLSLRGVTFGYSALEQPLISDFSLEIEPGQRVALVGGSGSGKSTVARLVAGLYEPWEGRILFDGHARQDISRATLATSLAIVDQDIFLFSGTLLDNLTMWNDSVQEKDVIAAAKDAHIHDDISARPGRYQYRVAEGGKDFSGGQRQRLEIARALVNNPSVLILDEATSALDPSVEGAIESALRRRGCTCLVVAHRLSAIRDCDEIIVMEWGRVVQRGTHEEMAGVPGPYRTLIAAG